MRRVDQVEAAFDPVDFVDEPVETSLDMRRRLGIAGLVAPQACDGSFDPRKAVAVFADFLAQRRHVRVETPQEDEHEVRGALAHDVGSLVLAASRPSSIRRRIASERPRTRLSKDQSSTALTAEGVMRS
jgi:hypothetical protein